MNFPTISLHFRYARVWDFTTHPPPWVRFSGAGVASEGARERERCASEFVFAVRSGGVKEEGVKVEMWAIGDVKPYERNPRVNDGSVDAIARSIQEFGWRQPIVVDKAGVIIVGHTRLKAAAKLGLATVPVHVATDLTEAQVKAYRIADNKLAELSEWDVDLLPVELNELHAAGVDLSLLGFDGDDLSELMEVGGPTGGQTDPDDVPAPPDAAVSKKGEVYRLGNHRLMCGDSGSVADLDTLLHGARIHLVNTDPPYNVKVEPRSNNAIAAGLSSFQGTTHHQGFDLARGNSHAHATTRKLRPKDRPLENDFVSDEKFDALLMAWFGNIARVLEPGRGFYIWGGYANCANYPPVLKACELYFSQAIIWVKEHPVLTRKDFMGNHEWCFYGWREGAAHQFYGAANVPDVWHLSRAARSEMGAVAIGKGIRVESGDGDRVDLMPPNPDAKLQVVKAGAEGAVIFGPGMPTDVWRVKKVNPQNMVHLTEKPVELAARAMRLSSRPGENVLDLFGGSGSTMMGAELTGRNAYLMELDTLYCDVIRKRWAEFKHGEGCDWQALTPKVVA